MDVADRMRGTTVRVQWHLRQQTKRDRRRCDESRLDCCSASRTSPETGEEERVERIGKREREES
jgi:hypothetical protein